MTLAELQEKRRKLAAKVKEIGDRYDRSANAWKTPEDRTAWEEVNRDYDANRTQLDAAVAAEQEAGALRSRLELIEADERASVNAGGTIPGLEDTRGGRPVGEERQQITDETRGLALAGFILGADDERFTERHAVAMRAVGMRPGQRRFTFPTLGTPDVRRLQRAFNGVHQSRGVEAAERETRNLSAFLQSTGGVVVGQTMLSTLEINMLAFGGMRQVAQTMVTQTGEETKWPTADDTSNEGEQLGENTSVGSSTDPSFGATTWNAYKFSSKPILVAHELLEDGFAELPAILGEMLGERLGRITNRKYTTGTGASTPYGITLAAALGVTAASATAIAADEVFQLIHSIDPAYRIGAGFMGHDNTLLKLRLLKDSQNRYLWQDGMQAGRPDLLLGYPWSTNQHMQATLATGTKTLLFGQLSRYKIRRVGGIRMYRLQERYRDSDQDGFLAFLREDGNLLNAGTNPVKYLVQA